MQILLLLTSLSLLSSTAFPLRANLSTNLDTTKFTPLSRRWTEPYGIAVCRGIRLSWAMQLPANLASQFLTPITSQFEDGNFNDALHSWGYSEGDALFERLCDFDTTHGLTTAFRALNIDPRSTERGGPNHCFHVQHQYTGSAKPVQDQVYWVGDRRYRVGNPSLTSKHLPRLRREKDGRTDDAADDKRILFHRHQPGRRFHFPSQPPQPSRRGQDDLGRR